MTEGEIHSSITLFEPLFSDMVVVLERSQACANVVHLIHLPNDVGEPRAP